MMSVTILRRLLRRCTMTARRISAIRQARYFVRTAQATWCRGMRSLSICTCRMYITEMSLRRHLQRVPARRMHFQRRMRRRLQETDAGRALRRQFQVCHQWSLMRSLQMFMPGSLAWAKAILQRIRGANGQAKRKMSMKA